MPTKDQFIESIQIAWLKNTPPYGQLGEISTFWVNSPALSVFIGHNFFQVKIKGDWITYWQNKDYKLIKINL